MTDLEKTMALQPDDACEFHFPARSTWHPGTVVHNGDSGYWEIRNTVLIPADSPHNRDHPAGEVQYGLYIEMVRAVGTNPWGD